MSIALTDVDEQLAASPVWYLDPWHTGVQFATRNRGAGKVRGRFVHVAGTVTSGQDSADATVHVSIDTSSISTGVRARDDHLRGGSFLNVAEFPSATFDADRFVRTSVGTGILCGSLTLRGLTRAVSLDVRWEGAAPDPFTDGVHLAFTATGKVSLADFGMRQELLPGLKVPGIGDAVELVLDVVLLPYDPQPLLADIPVT
jgi:polyisoprenoid-binding protein YceI